MATPPFVARGAVFAAAGAVGCAGDRAADAVDGADPSCLRLRCGHAFHATCIMATFRSGIGCPVCRDPLPLAAEAARGGSGTRGGSGGGGGGDAAFDADEDDGSSAAEADLATVMRLDERLAALRNATPSIQHARAAMRRSLRSYRVLCDSLRHARRQAITAALGEFRHARRAAFLRAKREVRDRLREVEAREMAALRQTESAEDVRIFCALASQFEYRADYVMESQDYTSVDPLDRRFWTR